MKKTLMILSCLSLLSAVSTAAPHADWFDLESCTLCRNLTTEKGLLDAMSWENHLLSNGMMSVTAVPAEYVGAFERTMAQMEKSGAAMTADDPLCNYCRSFGALLQDGVQVDRVKSEAGYITVVTSRDPQVVERIRTHAEATIEAHGELARAEESGHTHH